MCDQPSSMKTDRAERGFCPFTWERTACQIRLLLGIQGKVGRFRPAVPISV